MSMFLTERHQYILEQLAVHGKVHVNTVAKQLNVTPETIRRDLDRLEKERKLKRVHGGAVNYSEQKKEPHFSVKQNTMAKAKEAIGRKAAQFVNDGDRIVVDVGTTTLQFVRAIRGVSRILVVTNSLVAAEELNRSLERGSFTGKVIVLGGVTNPYQRSIAGSLTCQMLEQFAFDKAFLSCGGITPDFVTDYDLEESHVSEMMVARSREVFVLSDHTKLGSKEFYKICPLSHIQHVICNRPMPASWGEKMNARVNWLIAED